jgi:hypothetical protein
MLHKFERANTHMHKSFFDVRRQAILHYFSCVLYRMQGAAGDR